MHPLFVVVFSGDDANSNQECRMVFHSTQDNLNSVVIRKLSKTTPGNGPLFPSKREDKLFMVGVSSLIDGRLSARAIETFDYISMDENAYDLTATMRKNSIHSNSPFRLIMRKNGDLIAFKLLTYKGNIDNGPLFESGVNEDFGYCWRN